MVNAQPFFSYERSRPDRMLTILMTAFALSMVFFGFLADAPTNILQGLRTIILSPAGLISDSLAIGGLGAAFVNAGLVMLFSVIMIKLCRLHLNGTSIACLFLMAGFSLFGKDIVNIFPIIIGGWLYAKVRREPFSRYLYISLFGTSLSPVVSELMTVGTENSWLNFIMGLAAGIIIGFILPPVAAYTLGVHQGYNLYNVGFAAGLIGMVLVSISESTGRTVQPHLVWSTEYTIPIAIYLYLMFTLLVFAGFLLNNKSFRGTIHILRHSGRAVADFILLDGLGVTLINMGFIGAVATSYVLLVKGPLNGPTVGGILTICGFGAFGKHIKNITPVVLGVVLASFLAVWDLNDPKVLLAALFSTALAPIAGQFGWIWGIVAGVIHSSVVLVVGTLHGGLNLYNNGFAAGLVCIVLVPLIEAFRKEDDE